VAPNDLAYMVGAIETDKKVPFYKNIPLLFKDTLPSIYKPFNIKIVRRIPRRYLP
jgi:hypothetical protein